MHYDIVIVGGGVVGAGFAAALASLPIKIALIDAHMPSNNDGRLFALNYGSCQFLKNMGIWQQLEANSGAIHQVHVSHKGHFGAVRLNREEACLDALGFVVPAKHIEKALNEQLALQENLDIYRPASLQTLSQAAGRVELSVLQDDRLIKLSTQMLVGADGAESTVREQAGIEVERVDYAQTAIVTRTTLKRPHHHIAYERFVEDGAIAMLPLNENECATIWSASHHQAKALLALDELEFLAALQAEFGYRLGRLQSVTQRFSYPLKLVRAKKNQAGQVILLGNAAHAVHPIAAQGFNLALYEVALFVEVLAAQLKREGLLNMEAFSQVSAQIKKQQTISITVSHKLADVFASKSHLKHAILHMGMVGLDVTVPAKKRFVSAILGRDGRVPKLLMDGSG